MPSSSQQEGMSRVDGFTASYFSVEILQRFNAIPDPFISPYRSVRQPSDGCGSLGARVNDGPEGQDRPDDRRQGDRRKIAGNDRWRAAADGHFPQVETGMGDEPQRRGGPQPNAPRRSDHTDAERDAEEQLNNPLTVPILNFGELSWTFPAHAT
jgi:hypothetical protein